ncbi:mechanosensitive ion channel [Rhizobium sp. TRM95001]|nr:mechanosensitive ion channel domain-containing protein [Rhizobium halophilum]MCF6370039.1 mechanosensitive ion channel [Rhizobium halophilum]
MEHFLWREWGIQQLGLIALGFLLSALVAQRLEPAIEGRARTIRGNPDLLRLVIALMRRTKWLIFIVWLWVAVALMRQTGDPLHVWLISKTLVLATAWLVVSVLTRIIRNRSVARIVAVGVWIYLALRLVELDEPVAQQLNNAAIQLGAVRLSLLAVIKGVIVSAAVIWAAIFLGNIASNRVERASSITPTFRVLISKLIKIVLILLAGAVVLSATGIDLTALTVFSGAIGVGLGFGLQKVVSNFLSGIIILLDKSIKPGDTISLGDTFGWVRELRARFVSVITRDGKEYLIPNENFITEQVVNWSFSNEYVRVDLDFGVAYSADPHEVARIASQAAKANARVTTYRDPVCWLTAFGASSLDFKLRFWIADPSNGISNVKGEILMLLWDEFKKADINIPFPHREIIMKTPVEVAVRREAQTEDGG